MHRAMAVLNDFCTITKVLLAMNGAKIIIYIK